MLLNTPCRGIVDTNFESKRISITSALKFQEKKEKVEAKTEKEEETKLKDKDISNSTNADKANNKKDQLLDISA
ncbi:TPA: hypothetical protein R4421_001715 [Campylobacter jejuni]|uniref:hypothetical protein n=1 Tax=Campylobacter TaxID=194 RepID=UPI0005CE821E|nr:MULTISPECIES: hypothetical protein [Campylobacter]EAH6452201.1 hypothetical protein [Campylobacter jejuni]EAI0804559.1 hypothetical protein [Campylobacter jejuni]EAI0806315.1 hypothetical protein [Campylobacter jejuni]EAK1852509.1 hypothetical protein [Campylobacter jejuni]ECO7059757.1 hypothetical protein [Campylobacter jejuni]